MKNPIHIVLIEPEIPQNTGNIGRTCVGLQTELHLVGRLGFSLDSKNLKRAGLDYWAHLKFHVYEKWEEFLNQCPPDSDMCFFSTKGVQSLYERSFKTPLFLIFGSESRGLPPSFYETYREKLVKIPMRGPIRSLNLSTAVGVAAFEAVRKLNFQEQPSC